MCIFPIFMECKELTLDPYWQDIFIQCSIGKFPKGIRMGKDGSINIFNGKIKEVISLSGDIIDIFKIMMGIFKEKLGLISDRDIIDKKKEIKKLKKKIKEGYEGSWKQIKPKYIKNTLLLNFVLNNKKKYDLSLSTAKKLLSMIRLSLIFKKIVSDDIHYVDGVIKRIEGLKFNKGIFTFTISNNESNVKDTDKSSELKFNHVVERYIKDYKFQTIGVN